MDKQRFRQKVYENPELIQPELLAMAAENPQLQAIVDEARQLNARLQSELNSVPVPDSLAADLKSIPDQAQKGLPEAANDSMFQYFALAACLVMAIGISIATNLRPKASAESIEYAEVVLDHIYMYTDEIDVIASGNTGQPLSRSTANVIMANADSNLADHQDLQRHPIYFAEPCPVQPDKFDVAHLMVRGSKGAMHVIVTNNSPVETEFSIADDRFQGIVIPSEEGNIMVVGEKDENLSELKGLIASTVNWSI